jgi:hypothetical protein
MVKERVSETQGLRTTTDKFQKIMKEPTRLRKVTFRLMLCLFCYSLVGTAGILIMYCRAKFAWAAEFLHKGTLYTQRRKEIIRVPAPFHKLRGLNHQRTPSEIFFTHVALSKIFQYCLILCKIY